VRQKTHTIVVGHRTLVREGVAALLHNSIYKVVASISKTENLGKVRFPTDRRNLVIYSIDGFDDHYEEVSASIRFLRSTFSDCKIVLVAAECVRIDFERITSMAPDGVILNLESRDILLMSLELALSDLRILVLGQHPNPFIFDTESVASNDIADGKPPVATASVNPRLSVREQHVLDRLAQGKANKTIARECAITESTVKVHLKAILRKINVSNRTQAAIWAVAHGYGGATRVEMTINNQVHQAPKAGSLPIS
jgi:two-component system nitrate/nitrite response regulator NarL